MTCHVIGIEHRRVGMTGMEHLRMNNRLTPTVRNIVMRGMNTSQPLLDYKRKFSLNKEKHTSIYYLWKKSSTPETPYPMIVML